MVVTMYNKFKFETCLSNYLNLVNFSNKLNCLLLLMLCFLTISQKSQAILANTVNTIIGSKPKIVNIEAASNKHGFILNGVFYSSSSHNLNDTDINEFDGLTKFSDFIIKNYTENDLDNSSNYDDSDGDNIRNNKPFIVEQTVYNWFDNNGEKIPDSDIGNIIGCGSNYAMPLSLTLKTSVKTYSEYGNPNESESVEITKIYKIAPTGDVCYLKPNSTKVLPLNQWRGSDAQGTMYPWNTGPIKPDPESGGGYNEDFIVDKGFRARPIVSDKPFPTTGFPGAEFQLIMNYSQDSYTYNVAVNPGNVATVDQTGNVLLKAKPPEGNGDIVIRATLKSSPNKHFDYKFNPTSVWIEPQNVGSYDWRTAFNRFCGGIDGFPSRKDYSNSPVVNVGPNWQRHGKWNFSTRAINQGLYPEWGFTNRRTYPNSKWEWDETTYFTKDPNSDTQYFVIYLHDGGLLPSPRTPGDFAGNDFAFIACRK